MQLTPSGAGPLNVITPANVVAAVMTYAWPFANDTGGFIVIAIIYGYAGHSPTRSLLSYSVPHSFSSGVFVSLLAPPIVHMGEIKDVGTRVGMAFTLLALGAVAGPPISGAIQTATDGYKAVGYYAGALIPLRRQIGLEVLTSVIHI